MIQFDTEENIEHLSTVTTVSETNGADKRNQSRSKEISSTTEDLEEDSENGPRSGNHEEEEEIFEKLIIHGTIDQNKRTLQYFRQGKAMNRLVLPRNDSSKLKS